MTRGIMFYDEEYIEECKTFCKIRKIDYLPHINSSSYCYFFDQKKGMFEKRKIEREQTVRMDDSIYNSFLIQKFKEYEILFVKSGNKIIGVTHYSDYNRSPVYEDLYKKLFLLERGLIFLITEYSGLRKRDILTFLKKKVNQKDAERKLTKKDFRGADFSLKTILEFVQEFQLVKIREQDIHKIIALRNKIAHSDNLITKNGGSSNHMSYNLKSLIQLIQGVISLEVALKQVGNRLYFMEAIIEDDFTNPVVPLDEYLFK